METVGETILKSLSTPEGDLIESELNLTELVGSEKQVKWATDIRKSRLFNINFDFSRPYPRSENSPQAEEIMVALQSIQSAHWWIETRILTHGQFIMAALDKGFTTRYVTPPEESTAAQAVLDEALLAPIRAKGPVAEVSLAVGKVRVVLIEFDESANTLLKQCGFHWEKPAWTRQVGDDVAEHRATEMAVRLLAHGCPVRIFDAALRQRVVENEYEPESPRRVEVSNSAKYSTKFHLVWALDEHPKQCIKAASQLRGAKVFEDGAYVTVSHFEEIQDFASQNGFSITQEAQAFIDKEKGKLAGSVKVTAQPKAAPEITIKPILAPANGEIDAELLDD